MKVYYVYMIKNLINSKIYIGKTVDPERRWRVHKNGCGGCTALHNAIKKYGSENFTFEKLKSFDDEQKSYDYEKELIIKFNTKIPNGYNITDGGIGIIGNKKTKEHIEKVANAHRGMKRSEETKKRISESKKGKKNPYAIKSLEKAWEAIKNKQKVKVVCPDLFDGEMTAIDASKKYNIPYVNIMNCLYKKIKYAGRHPVTNEKLVWKKVI